jgi:hypothetical protein
MEGDVVRGLEAAVDRLGLKHKPLATIAEHELGRLLAGVVVAGQQLAACGAILVS